MTKLVALSVAFFGIVLLSRTSAAQPTNTTGEDPDPVPRPAFELGEKSVDPFVGSFVTSFAIEVPKFHGLEPQLALGYSSSSGNGHVGMGWSLRGYSTIERVTPGKGTPSYGIYGQSIEDIFLLDGQELVSCAYAASSPSCITGGTHATKIESYQRIRHEIASPGPGNPAMDIWTVWKKDGTRMIYVPITQFASAATVATFRWGVFRVVDMRGNQVFYGWRCMQPPAAQCYPSEIQYDGFSVRFHFESRPDPIIEAAGATDLLVAAERLTTIEVSAGTTRARAYALTYVTSGATSRSILSSIRQYGKDAILDSFGRVTGGTSLPPVTMDVSAENDAANLVFGPSNQWGPAPFFAAWSAHWSGDFNGDGRSDLLFVPSSFDGYYVMLSLGTTCPSPMGGPCGFATAEKWADLAPIEDWRSVFVQDLNADGRDDLMYRSVGPAGFSVALSTGSGCPSATGAPCGFGAATLWADDAYPTMFDPINPVDLNAIWVRELNGDGRPDLLYISAVPTLGIWARINQGGSFGAAELWSSIPTSFPQTAKEVWLGDFNGDAKTDLMYVQPGLGTYVVMINSGASFTPPVIWASYYFVPHLSAIRVADFNGDGRADLMYLSGFAQFDVLLSGGNSFAVPVAWAPYDGPIDHLGYDLFTPDLNADGRADLMYRIGGDYFARLSLGAGFAAASRWGDRIDVPHSGAVWIQDFTGDGAPDLMQMSNSSAELLVAENEGIAFADLVTETSNGLGGAMALSYVSSLDWQNANGVPRMQTVRSIRVTDGRGMDAETTFSYEDGLYDHVERRFLGFHHVTRTLPCIEGETLCPYDELWFKQDPASASKPERTERRSGDGELLSSIDFEYLTNGTAIPMTSLESARWTNEHAGGEMRRAKVEHEYDAFGNKTFEYILGDFAIADDERTVRTLYRPNTTDYIVGLPAATDTFAGVGTSGTLLEQTLVYYDQPNSTPRGFGTWDAPPSIGNQTELSRWASRTSSFVSTKKEYDLTGNVTAEEDESSVRTTITYDAVHNIFEQTRTNALGHRVSTDWDTACATKTRITDPNLRVTSIVLDALCRPTRRDLPAGGFVSIAYENFGTPTTQHLHIENPGSAAWGNIWREVFFDGLGRTYRKTSRGPSVAQTIIEETELNARGSVRVATEAHYLNETGRTLTTSYDGLDRPVRVVFDDGVETSRSYGVGRVTSTDELGHVQIHRTDVFGKNVEDRSRLGQTEIITSFAYDARQNLVGITDHLGNEWIYLYDSLGRRFEEHDPDLGARSYEFDAGGRLTAKVDALGQRTTLTYDAISRPHVRISRSGTPAAVAVTRTYDENRGSPYSNIGQLTSVSDQAGTATFDYDGVGQWLRKSRTIDNQTFTFERSLDAGSRVLWQRYPDGETMGTSSAPLGYDEAGRLASIPGILSNALYDAEGRLLEQTNANGTVSTFGYSASRGWLTSIRTTHGLSVLQDLTYTLDAEGKISAVSSPFANEGWSYSYDSLHRLTVARNQTSSLDTESFVYDAIGNIIESSRAGCYSYPPPGSPRPHAALQAGNLSFAYDDNGNMISKSGVSLVWDGEDRLLSIGADTFLYDADGERVRRTASGETTLYPSDDYEVAGDGTVTKYFKLGSAAAIAKRTGGSMYWLHADHLGSTQLVTNATGHQVQRQSYRPYGERLATLTAHEESLSYIGEHQDPNGLIYLHARYYDPSARVFVSADPTWPLGQGVGLNRYAYAGSNPIAMRDSSGRFAEVVVYNGGKTRQSGLIEVIVPVYFSKVGVQLSEQRKAALMSAAEVAWSGQFGEYTVRTRLVERAPNPRDPVTDLNRIVVSTELLQASSCKGTEACVKGDRLQLGSFRDDVDGLTFAHEVGHFLGLRDQRPDPNKPEPLAGWENTLMGDAKYGRGDERNIPELLNNQFNVVNVRQGDMNELLKRPEYNRELRQR